MGPPNALLLPSPPLGLPRSCACQSTPSLGKFNLPGHNSSMRSESTQKKRGSTPTPLSRVCVRTGARSHAKDLLLLSAQRQRWHGSATSQLRPPCLDMFSQQDAPTGKRTVNGFCGALRNDAHPFVTPCHPWSQLRPGRSQTCEPDYPRGGTARKSQYGGMLTRGIYRVGKRQRNQLSRRPRFVAHSTPAQQPRSRASPTDAYRQSASVDRSPVTELATGAGSTEFAGAPARGLPTAQAPNRKNNRAKFVASETASTNW